MVALAPKTQAKPKENDDWLFEPLKKTENRAKTENIFAPKSLIGELKRQRFFQLKIDFTIMAHFFDLLKTGFGEIISQPRFFIA